MEERIIDKDELRGVKRKRTGGEEDAVDELSTDADAADEGMPDYTLEFDEGDGYDEDLVGLTPSQLQEELERRERLREEAHAECVKYLASGEEKFAAGKFREAEKDFSSALEYEYSEESEERLYAAMTDNYTDAQRLLIPDNAERFADAAESVRARVLDVFGDSLNEARQVAEAEAQPLRGVVSAAQEERRGPFAENKKYYLVRFLAVLAAFAVFAIGIAVSSSFLLRTQSSVPTILTITFGVLTFAAFVVLIFFARKLLVAARLCRDNERLSSTEEGAQLEELEERLACLALVLDGAPEQDAEDEENQDEDPDETSDASPDEDADEN